MTPWIRALADRPELRGTRDALSGGHARVTGLSGPARWLVPLLVDPGPLLVVVPHERDLDVVTDDLRTLVAEMGRVGAVLPFPAPGPAPFRGLPAHPEAGLRRATALAAALRGEVAALVATPAGLLRPTLTRSSFETRCLRLGVGEELLPEMLVEALVEAGYRHEDPVATPGQMARRGGIVDVFPPDREQPVRLEFFGDSIESLNAFDPETQRNSGPLDSLELLPLSDAFATQSTLAALRDALRQRHAGHAELEPLLERLQRGLAEEELPELLGMAPGTLVPVWEYLPETLVVVEDPEAVRSEAAALWERAAENRERRSGALLARLDEVLLAPETLGVRLASARRLEIREVDPEGLSLDLGCRPAPRYSGDLPRMIADLRASSRTEVLYLGTPGRAQRLRDMLEEEGLAVDGERLDVRVGVLGAGIEWPAASLRVLADGDVFPEEVHLHHERRGRRARGFLSDFRDLRVGDLVVHEDHGIGRYEGLETLVIGERSREFMVLSYQGGDRLKVPVESFDRVQKYSSREGVRPAVDRLGSGRWEKTKKRVRRAMRDMAHELLRLYAERRSRPGHAFTARSAWLAEFEADFEYEETRDQAAAIRDVEQDMARPVPMDRLICGDVGYGKTEVAMRAAMRAVLDAKQVAVLTPTTVLAFQHWKTFTRRFAPFPVTIEMVSRFRSSKQVKQTLEAAREGRTDILVGTHRLLSKDVAFRDLGLVVVDEEQRFGVAAKERLKQLKTSVDCLTLSATPIPRTLQMGLFGLRDMSVIETPPRDRLAIQTSIVKFSQDVVVAAVRQELARGGQVFLVHNRVDSIDALAAMVQELVPEARVVVAHGQMPESRLEKVMLSFVEGHADVLVTTTIIENGLDIPRANTLLVNRADRFGLGELYQLRGRVGRSDRRAYAYLLVPPDTVLSEIARKRLAAIRDFSDLGAGFRIAALDLELRGAGNLLGGQQSGHIEAVGFDLYLQLLEQTILEIQGEALPEGPRIALNLRLELRIPEEYVPDAHQRMSLYKRLSQARSAAEVHELEQEIQERYGAPPSLVRDLVDYARARARAEGLGVQQIDLVRDALVLKLRPQPPLDTDGIVGLVAGWPGASLLPEGGIRAPLGEAPALDALDRVLGGLEACRTGRGTPHRVL